MKGLMHKIPIICILTILSYGCGYNKYANNKNMVIEKNSSYDLIVFFEKNKNKLNNKEETKVVSFLSKISKDNSVAIRVWIAPSWNLDIESLNLSWMRLKKLYGIIAPITDDIELFYDPNLEKDTALISTSWSN